MVIYKSKRIPKGTYNELRKIYAKEAMDNVENKSKNKAIIPITQDTIRDLRMRGMGIEASELLGRFHEEIKAQGKQAAKELLDKDRRIRHHFHICVYTGCNQHVSLNPITKKHFRLCDEHRLKATISYKKHNRQSYKYNDKTLFKWLNK